MREKLRGLLRRAGLGSVPTPVLLVALIVCLAFAGWGFSRWGSLGSAVDTAVRSDEDTGRAETTKTAHVSEASTEASEQVETPVEFVAHIVGAVMRPGVYTTPEGSRVGDIVALAGGLTGSAEERAVNLARYLVDGEQIVVPTQDEWAKATESPAPVVPAPSPASPGAPPPESNTSPGPIDVNTADAATLETLPGVGPVTAANIIAEREKNGPFETVDDLLRVSGIGDARLAAIRELVVVG